ncbi:MAG: hypothetical protein QGF56_04335 [Verrucomicrobiota bacterium]|nr:hypothetical protein [Verrucomicrobiota bacterium]MDP6752894.1 hypothetical protein [Verrucomicrobiota bacterium]
MLSKRAGTIEDGWDSRPYPRLAKRLPGVAEASWSAVLRTALDRAQKRQGLPHSKTLARSP